MRCFIPILLVGLTACMPRGSAAPQDAADRVAAASGPAVSLERTPCFGGCPVYRVSVSPAGLVTYQGKSGVRHMGTATGQIPPKQVDELLLELERAGFFTFADRYAPPEPTCRRYSTDSPSAISSATFRGRSKRIVHDYGCRGVPGALTVLEKKIDEVLGSARWTGK
ncbi:MAG TPA: DUF6438 domain-containing protein [Gemmatimonadales bacterium]|nr:DUF6438 domain-containing protein [Gemmatimonadales bacterium]